MYKQLMLIPIMAVLLTACDRGEKKDHVDANRQEMSTDANNTGRNVRDRDENAVTPFSQKENAADRSITQTIRSQLMKQNLSMDAKNIKIVSENGKVTLRGPVANEQEKMMIGQLATNVSGVTNVNNLLEVERK